tara:strand:- start:5368 stop:6105 length:738 start_codon:yes stop_codon:yes gene_type:complete
VPRAIAYYRPDSVEDAVALLQEPSHRPLAGGTILNGDDDPTPIAMVDLQGCSLDGISDTGDSLRMGAMTTLQDLVYDERVPTGLSEAARAELPSTLRTLATVGGTVATGNADSVLLAALLVHEARIELLGPDGHETTPLEDILTSGLAAGHVVTAVEVDPSGGCARHSTARTPSDTPIVSATARVANDGLRLALTGVADHPVLVDPADPTAGLDPIGDFRGSADYRRKLAEVLAGRALLALEETA